eukprot:TRINITY_DN1583_c0_g1_i1.p1 TRINITY_DN1583_c0_g1~~TRINITY_DN1583_c0_g1_i1.p1  ORF type:complete len:252 (-),score=31.22 TRINITY_DN1583_c0_g1_i1:188-943(-)
MSLSPLATDILISTACLIAGVVTTLFGYRLFRVISGCVGFLTAGIVGYAIVYYFIYPSFLASLIVGCILGGFAGIIFCYYFVCGVFVFGSYIAFWTALVLISTIGGEFMDEDDNRDVILISFALVGGLLSLRFRKLSITICSSILGSYVFFAGMDLLAKTGFYQLYLSILDRTFFNNTFTPALISMIVFWILLAVLGAFVQNRLTAKGVELENFSKKGFKVPSFFGRKEDNDADNVPLLEVITYIEDESTY